MNNSTTVGEFFTQIGGFLKSMDHTSTFTTRNIPATIVKADFSENDYVRYAGEVVKIEEVYGDGSYNTKSGDTITADSENPVYKVRYLTFDKNTNEYIPNDWTDFAMQSSLVPVEKVSKEEKETKIGKKVIIKETDGFGIIADVTEHLTQVIHYDGNMNPVYRETGNFVTVWYKPEDFNYYDEPEMAVEEIKEDLPYGFSLYEKEDGLYWLGIYSNNFQDKDRDILTTEAHETFVKNVNDGQMPYPELWVAHYPVQVGTTEMLDFYKESGMAIAGGKILPEWEDFMKDLVKNSMEKGYNLAMSHGFGRDTVVYDEEGYIKSYASRELTVTPFPANVYTQYEQYEAE